MNYIRELQQILGQNRYLSIFIILVIIISPIFAISSNIIIPQTFELNPVSELSQVPIVASIVLLMTLNGTVLFHNYEMRKLVQNKSTFLGGFAAFFTSTCSVCQPIWLVWLGLGSSTAFLAQYGLYLGLLSIGLLVVSLYYSLKSSSTTCEVKINDLRSSQISDISKSR